MKLEVGKTYVDSYKQKVKIIGKDDNTYFGLVKKDHIDMYNIEDKVEKYEENGGRCFSTIVGKRNTSFDLVRQYFRDPLVLTYTTTIEELIKTLQSDRPGNTGAKFKIVLEEIMD